MAAETVPNDIALATGRDAQQRIIPETVLVGPKEGLVVEVGGEPLADRATVLAELGVALEAQAQRVLRKGDLTTAYNTAATRLNRAVALPAVLVSMVAGVVDMAANPNDVGAVAEFLGLVGATFGTALTAVHRAGKNLEPYVGVPNASEFPVPDGYTVQCLRANADRAPFTAKEAVAVIHPRQYKDGERQAPIQARGRLSDALTVVLQAPTVSKIMLPLSVLNDAVLSTGGAVVKTVDELLLDMRLDSWIKNPYGDGAAVVLDQKAAARLKERIVQTAERTQLAQVLNGLAECFPLMRLRLHEAGENDAQLTPLLHSLLFRVVASELPSAQRERGNDDVGYFDRMETLSTQVDVRDTFDPLVIQRRTTNYQVVEQKHLSEMVGEELHVLLPRIVQEKPEDEADIPAYEDALAQAMVFIGQSLESGAYTSKQLIAIALWLVERRQKELDQKTQASKTTVTENQDIAFGGSPVTFSGPTTQRHPKFYRESLHHAKRLVATALIGYTLLHPLVDELRDNSMTPGHVISQADLVWTIDSKGKMPSTGYWQQNVYDQFDASQNAWSSRARVVSSRTYAQNLPPNTPQYLNVSTVTNSSEVDLPMLHATSLSAMMVYDRAGNELPATVETRQDGTMFVRVENHSNLYRLTYALVPDDTLTSVQHAFEPLAVSDPLGRPINLDLPSPHSRKNPTGYFAHQIADNLTYDATTQLRDTLQAQDTVASYEHVVLGGGRCDCVECATAAALAGYSVRPINDMTALNNGYQDAEQSGTRSYLESSELHAWLIDQSGTIIDATARKTDANSNVPVHPTIKRLDTLTADGGWSAAVSTSHADKVSAASAANQGDGLPVPYFAQPAKELWVVRELKDLTGVSLGLSALSVTIMAAERFRPINKIRTAAWNAAWGSRLFLASTAIDPNHAVAALSWEAYGGTRPLPTYDAHKQPLSIDNVPRDVLERVAKEGARARSGLSERERRATRTVAKVALAIRDEDKHLVRTQAKVEARSNRAYTRRELRPQSKHRKK